MVGKRAEGKEPSPKRAGQLRGLPRSGQVTPREREKRPAGPRPPLRVLIADHDGLARWTMRAALQDADRVATVHVAGDAREAMELARYYRPAVAIIDTALPPDGAVELIGKLLQVTP